MSGKWEQSHDGRLISYKETAAASVLRARAPSAGTHASCPHYNSIEMPPERLTCKQWNSPGTVYNNWLYILLKCGKGEVDL